MGQIGPQGGIGNPVRQPQLYFYVFNDVGIGSARIARPDWTTRNSGISSEIHTLSVTLHLPSIRMYRAHKVILGSREPKVVGDHQDPLVEEASKELSDKRVKG